MAKKLKYDRLFVRYISQADYVLDTKIAPVEIRGKDRLNSAIAKAPHGTRWVQFTAFNGRHVIPVDTANRQRVIRYDARRV